MLQRVVMLAFIAATFFTQSSSAQQQNAVRNDLPQPYRTTRDWGQLPPGVAWAAVTAVEPAPDGTIYVVHRCFENSCAGRKEAPILKYDRNGKLLASWGEGMFIFPHGATVDRDGNLWVTDARGENGKGHQVFKFNADGKVLMTLGKAGVSGSGADLFDQPTDVLVAPDGDIFVTDSHRNGKNNRVVKLTKDGKFIKEWGKKGSGPGEISEPHTIAMDSQGRLFVGDRENNRIQIFDQDGKFIAEWRQFGRPSGITITRDDTIYVTDSESGPDTGARELPGIKKGIRIGSAKTGVVTAFIEDMESTVADHSGAEGWVSMRRATSTEPLCDGGCSNGTSRSRGAYKVQSRGRLQAAIEGDLHASHNRVLERAGRRHWYHRCRDRTESRSECQAAGSQQREADRQPLRAADLSDDDSAAEKDVREPDLGRASGSGGAVQRPPPQSRDGRPRAAVRRVDALPFVDAAQAERARHHHHGPPLDLALRVVRPSPRGANAGLKEAIITAIATGKRPTGMDADEEIVYNFCSELLTTKQVSDKTFEATKAKFGERGVVDLIGVTGYYQLVSMLLNTDKYPLPDGVAPELKPLQ